MSDYSVHPSAFIDENVTVGKGTRIGHFSHILSNTRIGENCVIEENVMIGPDVTIGNNCRIQNNVSIYNEVVIEDDVFCGSSCVFTSALNPRAFIPERKNGFKPTRIMKGATIGANATIVCGNTVGRYAFIGAGAVVTRSIPDYALVVGVPARPIGWVCKCGVKLKFGQTSVKCGTCGNEYKLVEGKIESVKEI